jgi:hypothetical protein
VCNKSTELNKSFGTHYSGTCYTHDVSLKSVDKNLCDCNLHLRTIQKEVNKKVKETDERLLTQNKDTKQRYLLDTVQTFAWPPPVFKVAFEGGRR